MESTLLKRYFWLLPLLSTLCVAMVLIAILLIQPFFGLMDDGNLLQQIDQFKTVPFGSAYSNAVTEDIKWGFIRPIYPLMTLLLYGSANGHPQILFLLNFFLVTFALGFSAYAWTHGVASKFLPNASETKMRSLFHLTFLGTFAWPWTHDLFLHPSLQEKLVLITGSLGLLWFGSTQAQDTRTGLRLSLLVLFAGFSSKTQFIIYLPALVLLLWDSRRKGARNNLTLVGLIGLSSFWIGLSKYIANQGYYTSQFTHSRAWINLLSPFALGLILMSGAWFLYSYRTFKKQPFSKLALASAPGLALLLFTLILLPRGIGGYLLSLAGGIVAFILAVVFTLSQKRFQLTFVPVLGVLAISVTAYRSTVYFGKLSDLRKIIYSEKLSEIAVTKGHITMSCHEGASSLSFYAKRFRGLELSASTQPASPGWVQFYIADSKLCPSSSPRQHMELAGYFPGSFDVFR